MFSRFLPSQVDPAIVCFMGIVIANSTKQLKPLNMPSVLTILSATVFAVHEVGTVCMSETFNLSISWFLAVRSALSSFSRTSMVIMEERRLSSSLSWHSSTWDRLDPKPQGVCGVWKHRHQDETVKLQIIFYKWGHPQEEVLWDFIRFSSHLGTTLSHKHGSDNTYTHTPVFFLGSGSFWRLTDVVSHSQKVNLFIQLFHLLMCVHTKILLLCYTYNN